MAGDVRAKVPSVDTLLRSEPGQRASATVGRPLLKRMLLATLSEVRASAADGDTPPSDDEILTVAIGRAADTVFGLTPVINATGVLLHTNLGRAPIGEAALADALAARGLHCVPLTVPEGEDAKTLPGSVYAVDRRTDDRTPLPIPSLTETGARQ